MHPGKVMIVGVEMVVAACFVYVSVNADIFEDPENLKVLPKDISPAKLRATMRGFAINTGSRCSDCHVHEDEHDFSTYEFHLDEKEKKRKARTMIRMVNDINSYLAENLDKPAAELVKVDCATCHRGQVKPEMLQDVLARTHGEKGLEAAISEYRSLRESYYGSYTFDFSEDTLLNLGGRMAKGDDLGAALGFLQLNVEFYPESARSYAMQGEVYSMQGNVAAARIRFTRSLELDPDNAWTKRKLDGLIKKRASRQ